MEDDGKGRALQASTRPSDRFPGMKSSLPIALWLALALCGSALAQPAPAAPAEMISNYRLQHGEGPVTLDPALNRMAQEQAAAMAAKDVLDHNSALAPFSSRIAAVKYQ